MPRHSKTIPTFLRTRPDEVGSPARRAKFMLIAMMLAMVVLSGRLVVVQAFDAENLAQRAQMGRTTVKTLTATRGDIRDANGNTLATTVERYIVSGSPLAALEYRGKEKATTKGPSAQATPNVNADVPSEPEYEFEPGVAGAAKALATVMEPSEEEIFAKLSDLGSDPENPSQYTILQREVTPMQWRAIAAMKVPGIHRETVLRRVYPAGALAGNVIGFLGKGADEPALGGLESTMDEYLRGIDGHHRYEEGGDGTAIPMAQIDRQEPVAGKDIELTLNQDIQWYAQEVIASTVKYHEAEWGAIIVQRPKTGEILALAEAPTFDPNEFSKASPADRGSRALRNIFEPGSTAKVITAAMALEEGLATPETKLKIPYQYQTKNGQRFRDSHGHADQNLTWAGVLADSSNTGTVMVGQKASRQTRYDYLRKFGFGERTALNFPGETKGILGQPDEWDGRQQYAVLFGQGVAVNALQATQVFSAVANDGVLMPARLVQSIDGEPTAAGTDVYGKTADGADAQAAPDNEVRDEAEGPTPADAQAGGTVVVTPETARAVRLMLEGVVDGGTGGEADVPGYRVAGKTGTSQAPKDDGRGYDGYTASFIGMAPADDPELVVSVIVQRPRENGHYGGTVAGPAFRKVLGYSLQTLRVPPSRDAATLYATEWE